MTPMTLEEAAEVILGGQKGSICTACAISEMGRRRICLKCGGTMVQVSQRYATACALLGLPQPGFEEIIHSWQPK